MLLPKPAQDDFFNTYLPLLYYTAVYESIIPEDASITYFFSQGMDIQVESRNELFKNSEIAGYFFNDNGQSLSSAGRQLLKDFDLAFLAVFIVLKQEPDYAVLIEKDSGLFYEVVNITQSFNELLPGIPCVIETAILNYNGQLVCDGMVKVERVTITPAIAADLLKQYEEAKAGGKVIRRLG